MSDSTIIVCYGNPEEDYGKLVQELKDTILPAGTDSIVCGDDYYGFFDKDWNVLKLENKGDSCMSKITIADLPSAPEDFLEKWFGKRMKQDDRYP